MRFSPRLILPALIALAVTVGAVATQLMPRGAEAVGGAILDQPIAQCDAAGNASVTLRWTLAAGTSSQWIEYTLHDNGFAPDTFGVYTVPPDATSFTLTAWRSDLPNFWRVMSQTPNGVVASDTGQFMPCYRPILLIGAVNCTSSYSAVVDFRWAPLAKFGGQQWLEYDNNGDFAGSDMLSVGPISPAAQSHGRGGFHSGTEYYFRIVRVEEDGTRLISQTGYFVPNCTPVVNPDLYPSDDWLVSPSMGINAPVNVRDVGWDGALGNPSGAYDVVRYNFGLFPNLAAKPGGPGTVLVGGHVDYYVVGLAVFHPLRSAKAGDVIEYWDGNVKYTYVVDWVGDIPYDESLNPYLGGSGSSLLLITCNGTFDRAQFGGYNLRRLVHAVLQ